MSDDTCTDKLVHTCNSFCLARKKPSHALVVEDVCCPAMSKPIIIPAISSSSK